jgi:hypothetical protein
MFISIEQKISEASIIEHAPAGFAYDDPWEVTREVARRLRQQYSAWLEGQYPDAMIEVNQVKEGMDQHSTEAKAIVFQFGKNDNESENGIESIINNICSRFDMDGIGNKHAICAG